MRNIGLLACTAVTAFALIVVAGGMTEARAGASARQQTPTFAAPVLDPQRSVWSGVYTAEQARRGAREYQTNCSRCHGKNLEGHGGAPALVGAPFFDRWGDLSVQDLFFSIEITMSHTKELFVPVDTTADIVSFVFRANKIPPGSTRLPVSEQELRQILITRAAPRR